MNSLYPKKIHGKYTCTAAFIFLSFSSAYAQNAGDYQFTASSGTYTALSGATTVTVSNADDGFYNGIPMGFNFIFGGVVNYTDIHVSTNGWLTLGTSSSNNAISAGNTGPTNNFTVPPLAVPIIAPLWDNNSLVSTTGISYITSGSSPNRVTTVQYSNVKCTFNAVSANIQFQVKFYETTNVIRFVYQSLGGSYTTDGSAGLSIGIATASNHYFSLNGAGPSPTASSVTNTMSITSLPASGQTYTFTPPLITTANGDYNTASTWAAGTVPAAGATTYVLHAVTVNSALTNTGNINVGTGASLTVSSTLTNTGTLDMNGTFQLNSGYVMTGTAPVYGSASTLVYNTTATVGTEWTGNGTAAALGVPQNVTIQNSAVVTLPATNRGMAGSFDLLSGSLVMGAADLYVGGNWTRAGGTTFTPNSRTVVFDGVAAQQVITITGGGTETFSGFTLDNTFGSQQAPAPNLTHVVIDSTLTFVTGKYTIGTSANANTLTVNSGISGSTTSSCIKGSSESNLVLGGHGALTLTIDPTTPGTTNNIYDLTINRSGPGIITLTNSLQVSGLLTLTDGILLTTGGGPFTIVAGGSATAGSNASFVSGPMEKIGNTAFEFPVGKSGKWAAIGISAPSNVADVFTAEYFPVAYSNLTLGPSLVTISSREYWDLSRTGSASNITVTLYFNSGSFSGIYSVLTQDLVLAYFDGTDWDDPNCGVKTNTGTTSAGTVSMDGVNSVGFFTFGCPSGVNPLPVSLTEFTATAAGRTAELEWRTESEINNDHFDIERSHDGIGFTKAGQVGGSGTVNTPKSYTFTDYQLPAGNQPDHYYYRLKQVDYNGDFEYSPIRSVTLAGNQDLAMRIFPNPFTDQLAVSYVSGGNHKTVFTVTDAFGRVVLSREVAATDGMQNISWDASGLARGVYFIRMSSNGVDRTVKMIKE